MNHRISIPEFNLIESKLTEIKNLASSDPLISIIQERFQQQITHHLTSLKSKSVIPNLGKNIELQSLKQAYLRNGKEHAVTQLVFDLANQKLTTQSILLLAAVLFDETSYRTNESYIQNISGNRQPITKAANVVEEMEKLTSWYSSVGKKERLNPIEKASILHYKITTIQPFNDWNGRIARLLLNISLMGSGMLPILIKPDERLAYYENLELADNGNIEPLIRFIANKEIETIDDFMSSPEYLSIKGKYELKEQLKNVTGSEKCIVLTEDSATHNLIELILKSSGFNLNETKVISYEGCSKIASANLFSIFVKEKMPYVKILVHRDRDYMTDAELKLQKDSFSRIDTKLFITRGTDIESYLLNAEHVSFCFPSVSVAKAEKLIAKAMEEVFPKSVDYLRKKEFGGHNSEIHTHLNQALEELVTNNLQRFSHGKTTLKILQYKLNDLTREKKSLEKASPYLCVEELQTFAKTIWH